VMHASDMRKKEACDLQQRSTDCRQADRPPPRAAEPILFSSRHKAVRDRLHFTRREEQTGTSSRQRLSEVDMLSSHPPACRRCGARSSTRECFFFCERYALLLAVCQKACDEAWQVKICYIECHIAA